MKLSLQQLNLENIGVWPWAIKTLVQLVLFLIVLFVGYYFFIQPNLEQLTSVNKLEGDYKQQLLANTRHSLKLQNTAEQVKLLHHRLSDVINQMPDAIEMASLLEDISSNAQQNNLKIELLKPQAEEVKGFYEEQPVRIIAHGNYHQLANFISALALENKTVSFAGFRIKQGQNKAGHSTGLLTLDLTAVVFRYIQPKVKQ